MSQSNKPKSKKQCNSSDVTPKSGGKRERVPSSPASAVVSLSEEEIRHIIDNAIQSARSKIREDMTALIYAKHQQIVEELESLKETNTELTDRLDSLEHDHNTADAALNALKRDVDSLKVQNSELREQNIKLATRCNDIEQWTRKSAIRVFGVQKMASGREDCISVVHSIIKDKLRLDIPATDIEVAHRVQVSRRQADGANNKPPAIIVKFARRDVRDRVLRARSALKNTGITFSEDLTKDNQKLLMEVRNHTEVSTAWSWNGKIFGKIHNSDELLHFHFGDDVRAVVERACARRRRV